MKPQHPHSLPTTGTQQVNAFPAGYGRIVGGELNHLMRRMMQQGPEAVSRDEQDWPVASLSGKGVEAEVRFTPTAQSPQADLPVDQADLYRRRMWYLVRGMDDLTADCWDAIMAQWVAEARSPDSKVWITVDQILQYRGLASYVAGGGHRGGGFNSVQRAAVTEALLRIIAMRLQLLSMTVIGDNGQPAQRQLGGPALEVGMDLSQTDFLGQTEIKALLVRPGEIFARYYMGAGRPVALLSQKALSYRLREEWEKRLTRYFAYSWDRTGAEGQHHTVAQLLDAVHHEPNTNRPEATKDRLEKALRRLAEDRVIAGWDYAPGTWDEASRPNRRWLSIWLDAQIIITPPAEVRTFYALGLPDGTASMVMTPPGLADGLLTGESILALRQHVGLSQEEFAADLGVTRSLIALVETGRRPPSKKLQERIRSWLACQP